MNETINVVYTFDDAFAEITGVSLISLFENNRSNYINIYAVDYGISSCNKEKLQVIAKRYSRKINFIPAISLSTRIPIKTENFGWSEICYERLFYGSLLPLDVDKVLHIDCDTMIRDSLDKVYSINIDGYYLAACHDCYPKPRRLIEMKKDTPYLSNGLILINLRKWRDDKIEQQFVDYIVSNDGKLHHLDQDVMNYVCSPMVKVLPARYNVMSLTLMYGDLCCGLFSDVEPYYSKKDIVKAVRNPAVVHFTGSRYGRRPWEQPSAHWYNKEWLHYYKMAEYSKTKQLLVRKRKFGLLKHVYSLFWINMCKVRLFKKIRFNLDKYLLWKI